MNDEIRVVVESPADLVRARYKGRALAAKLDFSSGDQTLIATAISELARNIINYVGKGEIILRHVARDGGHGIVIIAEDNGPGIPDVSLALQSGFSTSGSLGLGLPGVRRIVDEFELLSTSGQGTTVTAVKWKH